jgi:CRP-like cAMP-binding protein
LCGDQIARELRGREQVLPTTCCRLDETTVKVVGEINMGGGLSRKQKPVGRVEDYGPNGGSFAFKRIDSSASSGSGDSISSRGDNSGHNDLKPKVKHLFEKDDSDNESCCSSSTKDPGARGGGPLTTATLNMTPEDEDMLKEVLSRFCYIESGMNTSTLHRVVKSMELESLSVGQCLLKVGEKGDKLYVVNDGELNVTISGRHIRTVRRRYVLGELAILYNEPRTATVVAATNCSVWSLRRDVFKKIQTKASSVVPIRRARHLINCPELAALPPMELAKLASALKAHVFNDGDVLYSEGELTNRCILIEDGNAEIMFSERSFTDVVKPLLDQTSSNTAEVVDDLVGVHRPPLKVCKDETINAPSVSRRASFSLMSTVPEDSEPHAALKGPETLELSLIKPSGDLIEPSLLGASPTGVSSMSDLRSFLISKVSWASSNSKSSSSKSVSGGHVGVGCLLGVPILRGKAGMNDSWKWYNREDLLLRGKDVAEGAKTPCTITARGPVKAAIFTAERFETLFGPFCTLPSLPLSSTRTDSMSQPSSSEKGVPMLRKFKPSDFVFIGLLGKGAFGNVLLAECDEWDHHVDETSAKVLSVDMEDISRFKRRQVAVKIMSKWEVVDLGFARHVCDERQITAELSSVFVLKIFGTYQTPEMIALVTEALPSKDLWSLIYQKTAVQETLNCTKGLPLTLVRFYTACMALAFSHIHEHGVAYRDVKPENIMIDEMGYIRIIDFGFAKKIPFTKVNLRGEAKIHSKTYTLCGTPGLATKILFECHLYCCLYCCYLRISGARGCFQ